LHLTTPRTTKIQPEKENSLIFQETQIQSNSATNEYTVFATTKKTIEPNLQRKNTHGGLQAFTSTAFLSRRSSSGFQGVIGASAPMSETSLSLSPSLSLSKRACYLIKLPLMELSFKREKTRKKKKNGGAIRGNLI
jgi:hypothetical protein